MSGDDMVLVPRRLTAEMALAIERADMPVPKDHPSLVDYWQPTWDAAIAAAPQPNSQGSLDGSPAALPKYKVTVIDNEHPDGIPLEQWMRRSAAAAPQQPAAQPGAADAGKPSGPTAITAAAGPATNGVFCSVDEPQQPAVQPEPMARFCPGCGSVGPVPEKYRDCCPDGDKARMIPEALEAHLTAVLIVFWGALWGTMGTDYARDFITAQLRGMEGERETFVQSRRQ